MIGSVFNCHRYISKILIMSNIYKINKINGSNSVNNRKYELLLKYACWLEESDVKHGWPKYLSIYIGSVGMIIYTSGFLIGALIDAYQAKFAPAKSRIFPDEMHSPIVLIAWSLGLLFFCTLVYFTFVARRASQAVDERARN